MLAAVQFRNFLSSSLTAKFPKNFVSELREKHEPSMFENKVLMTILGAE
jgi:hypothetical protein